jgi:hypothetical protein
VTRPKTWWRTEEGVTADETAERRCDHGSGLTKWTHLRIWFADGWRWPHSVEKNGGGSAEVWKRCEGLVKEGAVF